MKYLFAGLLLLLSVSVRADDWFCKTQSAKKDGNVMSVCGIGVGFYSEEAARRQSMKMAMGRFQELCHMSADCADLKDISGEPKRLDCSTNGHLTTCYQLIEFTLK